jgi:hypothetical protein
VRFVRLVLSFVFLLVVASLVACGSSQQTVAALHMSAGVARAICAAVGAVDGVISDEHTAPSGGVAASSGDEVIVNVPTVREAVRDAGAGE